MGHESQKSINIEELARQNPEAGDSLAGAISGDLAGSRLAMPKLDKAQNVLDENVDKGKPLKIEGQLLALRGGADDKATIEALKQAYQDSKGAYRDPPNPNIPAPPADNRIPGYPGVPGQGPHPEKPPEPKPPEAGAEITKARQALPNHFTATTKEQALAAKQKAKDLGLPLVVYIGVEDGCPPCKTAKASLTKLEGGELNGKALKGEKHGEAVFLHISAGENLRDRDGFEQAGTIAKSVDVKFGANNSDDEDDEGRRPRPFRPANRNAVPHIAIFDASGKNTYDKAGLPATSREQRSVTKALKDKIPAPLPANTQGLKA